MLFALLIHTKPLKVDIPARTKLRLHRTRDVNGTLHVELLHAALHNAELDGDDACHFDGAAEGDFAVALEERERSLVRVVLFRIGFVGVDGKSLLG